MATRYMFFDAVSGDRSYDAASMAALLRAVVQRDGVVYNYGSALAVSATDPASMNVAVATGAAFVQGRMFEVHTAAEQKAIGAANPTYPRIDRIVVRLDNSSGVRSVTLAVKAGTPAASPTPPALQRDGTVWELSLAQVYVAAGATSISAANITDERSDESLCGYTGTAAVVGAVAKSGDTMTGNLTVPGLTVTGALSGASLALSGALSFSGALTYSKTAIDRIEPVGVRAGNGGGGMWIYSPSLDRIVVKLKPAASAVTQLYCRIRDLSIGTVASPTVVEWRARIENSQNNCSQYVGLGEDYPSYWEQAIFIVNENGTAKFKTIKDGVETATDISGTVDMTVEHLYRVEWSDAPRARLLVDGVERANHTTNVPVADLLRFVEVAHGSTPPTYATVITVEPKFLMPFLT